MKLDELRKLIVRGEDSRLQFKANVNNADALAAEMVAFANSDGGQIAIGVGDDGKIVGLFRPSVERINQLISNSITGWKGKPTTKPTSFMMTTKFISILVLKVENRRQLARPLNTVQLEYLKALDVDPNTFISP